MAQETYVRTTDMTTKEETVDGPFLVELAAVAFAESRAEEFFGGDDVTWFEAAGSNTYHVGRVDEDGVRSEPLVAITIEDQEVELADDLSSEPDTL